MELGALLGRRAALILGVGAALTLLAFWPVSRLQLITELAAILPEDSKHAEDYEFFLDNFAAFEKVFVLLVAPAPDGSDLGPGSGLGEAAERLGELLENSPWIGTVRSGLSEEDLAFVSRYVARRAPLLLPPEQLESLPELLSPAAARRSAARIRALALSPTGLSTEPTLSDDPLNLSAGLPGLRGGDISLTIDPLTSAFITPDGSAALLLVTPQAARLDAEGASSLAAAIEESFRVLCQEHGNLRFFAVGGPLYAAHDEALLRRDLERSLSFSGIACSLLLVLAFQSFALPLAVVSALAIALVWTAAALQLSIGAVSGPSLGFAAVLIGLGIDYGIHGASRYRQYLWETGAPEAAMSRTFHRCGAGILSSALTTAAAFGVLVLAHFRPLRELGLMVAMGVVAMLTASATIGAVLALRVRTPRRRERPGVVWLGLGRVAEVLAGVGGRHSVAVLVLLVSITLLAAWGITGLSIDADPQALRSFDHPALEAEAQLSRHFGIGVETTTVLVHAAHLDDALDRAASAAKRIRERTGATVVTPSDWLVGEQQARARLQELRNLPFSAAADELDRSLRERGIAAARFTSGLEALRALGAGRDPGPPLRSEWPEWLSELVHRDAKGVTTALQVRLGAGEALPAALVEEIEAQVPDTVVLSAAELGNELQKLARRDLASLSVLSLSCVLVIVTISFAGSLRCILLSLMPVLLGSFWTLAAWAILGRTLDLMTLAVIPIILGIGVDDGLHVLHAWRRAPQAGLLAAVQEAGRAMVLTTLTTCVAFGSLSLSSVPGLRNSGILVSLGALACLLITLVALPAAGTHSRWEK